VSAFLIAAASLIGTAVCYGLLLGRIAPLAFGDALPDAPEPRAQTTEG
jgi:hypothetical protein